MRTAPAARGLAFGRLGLLFFSANLHHQKQPFAPAARGLPFGLLVVPFCSIYAPFPPSLQPPRIGGGSHLWSGFSHLCFYISHRCIGSSHLRIGSSHLRFLLFTSVYLCRLVVCFPLLAPRFCTPVGFIWWAVKYYRPNFGVKTPCKRLNHRTLCPIDPLYRFVPLCGR